MQSGSGKPRFRLRLRHRKNGSCLLVSVSAQRAQSFQRAAYLFLAQFVCHIVDQRCDRPDGRIPCVSPSWADRHHFAAGIVPIRANMHIASPNQLVQRVGHCTTRHIERLGQLRGRFLTVMPSQVIQNREMRNFHTLRQHPRQAVAHPLIGRQQFADQRDRQRVSVFCHILPIKVPRNCDGWQDLARGAARRQDGPYLSRTDTLLALHPHQPALHPTVPQPANARR